MDDKKIPKELIKNAQNAATDASDFQRLKYIDNPEKNAVNKQVSEMLLSGRNSLDNTDKDLKKILKSNQDPASVRLEVIKILVQATEKVIKDMEKQLAQSQQEQSKKLDKKDPEYERKIKEIKNGIVEFPKNSKSNLLDGINDLSANTKVLKEVIKNHEQGVPEKKSTIGKEISKIALEVRKKLENDRTSSNGLDENGLKDNLKKEKELLLVEYRIKNNIGSKEDFSKTIKMAGQELRLMTEERRQLKPEQTNEVSSINKTANAIKSSMRGASDKILFEKMKNEENKLTKAVKVYESQIKSHEQNIPFKPKNDQPLPKSKFSLLTTAVKDHHDKRYHYPSQQQLNSTGGASKNEQLREYEKQNMPRMELKTAIQKAEDAYEKDRQTPGFEKRGTAREKVVALVMKIAESVKKEMRTEHRKANPQNLNNLESQMDKLKVPSQDYKKISIEQIKRSAKMAIFTGKDKRQSQRNSM